MPPTAHTMSASLTGILDWEISSDEEYGTSNTYSNKKSSSRWRSSATYAKVLACDDSDGGADDSDDDDGHAPNPLQTTPFRTTTVAAVSADIASIAFEDLAPSTISRPVPVRGTHLRNGSFADGADLTDVPEPPSHLQEPPAIPGDSPAKSKTSRELVTSRLKKGWKAVKRTGAKSTASAGKQLSTFSATYWKSSPSSGTAMVRQNSEQLSADREEWVNVILPAWQKKRPTARVRTLLFRGVPPSIRGRVWLAAIGNPLNVSDDLFNILKERARVGRAEYLRGREALDDADGDVGGNGGRAEGMLEFERSAHKAIMLDLPRTFPSLAFFHAEGSHYEESLRDILEAFVYLRPDVGYSQGMSFLAAMLLLFMDPSDAFACFANMLLYKSCFLQFYRIKMPEVRIYLSVHDRLLDEEMPALHEHFEKCGVEANIYMINWVMSLYCQALPLDMVSRIWDIYVVDGDIAIFRTALGILKLFEKRLLVMNFEEIASLLSHLPADEIDDDALMASVRSVSVVTRRRFKDLFRECAAADIDPLQNSPTNAR